MVNSIPPGMNPIAVEIDAISIIAKSRLIKLLGSWHLEKVAGEEKYDGTGSMIDYDYLVNIKDSNNLIHPEDIHRIKNIIDDLQSGKKSEFIFRVITPAGEIKQLHGQGNFQNSFDDITERKKTEEDIIASKNLLEAVFNTSTLGLHVLQSVRNEEGTIIDFDILLTNATSDKIAGRKVSGLRMLESWPHTREIGLFDKFIQTVETGQQTDYEYLYEGDGVRAWFCWIASRLNDGLYVTIEDITELKKAEEQKKQNQLLAALNQAKTEFFSNVSHEFRTPLTLMLGPLNDVLKKFQENSVNSEDLHKLLMVQRNALRLQKLVNTLLDFSRIEAGRADSVFQPTDLAEYTTLLAGNFRSALENAGLKLIVKCESTEPIYINQDMWEKIVLNLLSNAFKFTFEGKIEVSLRSYKKKIQLRVRDTGIGISASNLSKIFERFTRIPNARSRTYEGTGIGLALVKELVNMHGGNIKVNSKEGEGTVFVVSIPKGKAHLPARNIYELKEKSAVSPLSSIYAYEAMNWLPAENKDGILSGHDRYSNGLPLHRKATVLLVDDNSDIREYIKSILNNNYIVATANNGKKALELISEGLMPDLILSDLMMPEMDGYSLLNEIKRNEQTARVPFIILSARSSEEARVEGIRFGADDYLVKPFSSFELLARIDSRIHAAFQNKTEKNFVLGKSTTFQ